MEVNRRQTQNLKDIRWVILITKTRDALMTNTLTESLLRTYIRSVNSV